MQNILTTLVTAICGALIAVAAVVVMTNAGIMPVNEAGLRTWLLNHPQVLNEMSEAAQQAEDARTAAAQAAAIKKVGVNAFFDPRLAFVTGPVNAPNTMIEFYDYDCPYCRASLPAVKFQSRKPVMSGIKTSRATLPRAIRRPGVIHALPPAHPATDGGFSRC